MSNSERPNPFPGLRPFRSDEHHLFFGREEESLRLAGIPQPTLVANGDNDTMMHTQNSRCFASKTS